MTDRSRLDTDDTSTESPPEEPLTAESDASGSGHIPLKVSIRDGETVPLWLAALVIGLLLAVMGVGGYILGATLSNDDPPRSVQQVEVQKWLTVVESNPGDMEAVLQLAYAYQQAGEYQQALDQYDRVLAMYEDDTAALYNKGIILFELARDDEAEEVLWDVLEIEPEHVLAAKALGEHYAEKGHYRSLVEAVRPVVVANESAADLQYLMGLAYENLGRPDWAEARYRLALEYYPDMAEAKDGLERLGVEP